MFNYLKILVSYSLFRIVFNKFTILLVLELFFNYIQNKKAHDLDERKLIGNGEYKIFTLENEKYKIL